MSEISAVQCGLGASETGSALLYPIVRMVKMNTDLLAYSDTLGNGQKCHYKRAVTVASHFYREVDPLEATKVSL